MKIHELLTLLALGFAVGIGCGDDIGELQYTVPNCGSNFVNEPVLRMFTKCAVAGGKIESQQGMCVCNCPGWNNVVITETNLDSTSCPPMGETEVGDAINQGYDMIDVIETAMGAAEDLAQPGENNDNNNGPPIADNGGNTPDDGGPDNNDNNGNGKDTGPKLGKTGGGSALAGGGANVPKRAANSHATQVDRIGPVSGGTGPGGVVTSAGGSAPGGGGSGGGLGNAPGVRLGSDNSDTSDVTTADSSAADAALAAAKKSDDGFESAGHGSGGGRSVANTEVQAGGGPPGLGAAKDVSPAGPQTLFDLARPHYLSWAEREKLASDSAGK